MSDVALRALERAVRTDDTPSARLSYALALGRAGRHDDAYRALRPAVHDAEVRSALARSPAWNHPLADAGHTCWLDVAPLTRAPRVMWRRETPRREDREVEARVDGMLLASPLGIVVNDDVMGSEHQDEAWPVVLDPETGATRVSMPAVRGGSENRTGPWALHTAIAGELLLGEGYWTVQACELWTGGDRGATWTPPTDVLESRVLGGGALGAEGAWTRADRYGFYPLLSANGRVLPAGTLSGGPCSLAAAAGAVYRREDDGELLALDAATGVERWRTGGPWNGPWLLADAGGVIATTHGGFALFDDAGRERWRHGDHLPRVLAPGYIVAMSPDATVTLDRTTGATRPLASAKDPDVDQASVAAARDVIYRASPRDGIAAFAREGDLLWRYEIQDVQALAVLPERVYAILFDGTVLCLGPPEAVA